MKRIFTLLLLSMAPALFAAQKPNIIFIMADDLGYSELGSYGQKKIKTPHLDQLAREGMRFTANYCGNAVCAPSRCRFPIARATSPTPAACAGYIRKSQKNWPTPRK